VIEGGTRYDAEADTKERTMTFASALFGGCVGFGIQLFANGARKIPYSRGTWRRLRLIGFGGFKDLQQYSCSLEIRIFLVGGVASLF
jgi:hypothetical protein